MSVEKTQKHYVPVIGIEVHVEPKTHSKMFCDCLASHFRAEPNSNVCPVCLGMPGALPVPNKVAIEKLLVLGKALGCKVSEESFFERKNYFYPDLPKGYQISQYRQPLCLGGEIQIQDPRSKNQKGKGKTIRINRVHMEEDTAKLKHENGKTLIDFNRGGVALIEIVSEADISSAQEAKMYLKELARLIRWLDISDADMEKGTMRLEANVSIQESSKFKVQSSKVMPIGSYLVSQRVELKNINSFKFVEKAIGYEINRQIKVLKSGGKIVQETRGWDEKKGVTFVQREKEESHDYRYFPEPDVPSFQPSAVSRQLLAPERELPWEAEERLMKEYDLPYQYISFIASSRGQLEFFDQCVAEARGKVNAKRIAGEIVNKKINVATVKPKDLAAKLARLSSSHSSKASMANLKVVIERVIVENPKAVSDYKQGKQTALQYLIGQVMRSLRGKADIKAVVEIFNKKLGG